MPRKNQPIDGAIMLEEHEQEWLARVLHCIERDADSILYDRQSDNKQTAQRILEELRLTMQIVWQDTENELEDLGDVYHVEPIPCPYPVSQSFREWYRGWEFSDFRIF